MVLSSTFKSLLQITTNQYVPALEHFNVNGNLSLMINRNMVKTCKTNQHVYFGNYKSRLRMRG